VVVDLQAPQPVTVTLGLRQSDGTIRSIEQGTTVHESAPTLVIDWTASEDGAGLRAYHVGWSTTQRPNVAALSAVAPDAQRRHEYRAADLQTLYAHVIVEDTNGNRTTQTLGPIMIDGPSTPDLIGALGQQAWDPSDAALVGQDHEIARVVDAGATLTATQRLFTSWDATALRLQWRGADWDVDGDLFIYLDTAAGGANAAFNPFGATGAVTLPSGMSADYVVWVRGAGSAQLVRADGGTWGAPQNLDARAYRFDDTAMPPRTDLLLPWSVLGITDPVATSLKLLALASDEMALRLWATVPDKNPLNSPRVLDDLAMERDLQALALTQALSFESLGAGVLPNGGRSVGGDFRAALDATPAGQVVGYLDSDLYDLLTPNQPLGDAELPIGTPGTPLQAGDTVTYTVRYANEGEAAVTGAKITVRAVGALQLTGGTPLVLDLPTLAPGTVGTRTLTARASGTGTSGEIIATVEDATHTPFDTLWVRHVVDRAAPTSLAMTTDLRYVHPGFNTIGGTVVDDAGVARITLELRPRPGTTVRTVECPNPTDNDSVWSCRWDAGDLNGITSMEIRGRATDIYGNTGAWTALGTFPVDTTPPTVTVDAAVERALADGFLGPDELVVSGQVRDNRAASGTELCVTPLTVECRAVAAAADGTQVAWTYDLAALPAVDGVTQTLGVRGTDDAGNQSATLERIFRLDTVAPVITATQVLTTVVYERYTTVAAGTPVLRGVVQDGGGVQAMYARMVAPNGTSQTTALVIDGDRWSFTPVLRTTGTYRIVIEAVDRAGNRSATSAFELAVRSNPNEPTPTSEPSPTSEPTPTTQPSVTPTLQATVTPTTTGTAGPSPTPTRTAVPTPDGGPRYRTFLPLVVRPPLPDLVARVRLEPDARTFRAGDPVTITVDIRNQGKGEADPFWVDLYINPSEVPIGNLPWDRLCDLEPCYGLTWAVRRPLAAGQQITLRSTADSYANMYSRWPGFFASGTTDLYVYVDSGVTMYTDGNVRESDETNNRVVLQGLRVEGSNPTNLPRANAIPPRPRLTAR
jgi:large repetitive protein